ncbi:hypothetical protein CEQ90_09140 [Lewinellaceae bacterium SD302]|nr:hypothetical protein CEQ90_09140 [Lewinellaceae bacterium SD302]
MKWNYLCLLMLAFTFVISGCGDDDDNSSADLVGTWEMVDLNYTGESSTTNAGLTAETDFTGTGINMDFTIVFNEDGTYITDGDYEIELTSITTFQGTSSTDVQVIPINDIMGNGEYSVSGNILTTMGGFISFDATGMTMTSPNEEAMSEFSLVGDLLTFSAETATSTNQSGVIATSSTSSVFVLERQ